MTTLNICRTMGIPNLRTKVLQWTDDEVELLSRETLEYKQRVCHCYYDSSSECSSSMPTCGKGVLVQAQSPAAVV